MAEQSIPESSEIRLVGQLDLGQEALLLPRKNLKPKFQVFPVSASQQLQFLIPFKALIAPNQNVARLMHMFPENALGSLFSCSQLLCLSSTLLKQIQSSSLFFSCTFCLYPGLNETLQQRTQKIFVINLFELNQVKAAVWLEHSWV
ncbi:hypothetical protein ACFX2I_008282 [Malus domestica]